ncbi:MAG: alpha/beta hydrolase [Bryobacterales bacterium]|nr:alpha/beta hydrolase [Bryobacterales bacterium]
MPWPPSVPLVLLHGWCGTPLIWQPVVEAIGAGAELVIPQLTHDGSLPELPQRCIVVGHSMGATLARRLLRHKAGSIAGAVLIDGHLPKFRPDPARRASFLQAFRDDSAAAASAYIDTLLGPRTPAAIKAGMLARPAGEGLRALESLDEADVCAWLGTDEDQVSVPVWALWASPTPMARVGEEHEGWMRRWCWRLRYEVWEGESHFLHLEQPRRFGEALRQWIEECGL